MLTIEIFTKDFDRKGTITREKEPLLSGVCFSVALKEGGRRRICLEYRWCVLVSANEENSRAFKAFLIEDEDVPFLPFIYGFEPPGHDTGPPRIIREKGAK